MSQRDRLRSKPRIYRHIAEDRVGGDWTWRWQTSDRVLVTGRAATYAEAVEAAEAARPEVTR